MIHKHNNSPLHALFAFIVAVIFSVAIIMFVFEWLGIETGNYLPVPKEMTETARIGMSLEELEDVIREGKAVVILDSRNKNDFYRKHIEESMNVPLEELVSLSRLPDVAKGTSIVLVNEVVSLDSFLSSHLESLGYSNVTYLEHGWRHPEIDRLDIIDWQISPHDLGEMIFMDEEFDLVDLRSKEEFKKASIVGAVSMPFEKFDESLKKLDAKTATYLYCTSRACDFGKQARNVLKASEGWEESKVRVLIDGFKGWVDLGYPTE